MANLNRRSLIATLGMMVPLGLPRSPRPESGPAPRLQFLPFEEALRDAITRQDLLTQNSLSEFQSSIPCYRVEVGPSEEVLQGLQGCHNDRPFAGFPAGVLRIIRTGSHPGPVWQGVRLHLTTVDVALVHDTAPGLPSRLFNFGTLPPAPRFCLEQHSNTGAPYLIHVLG